MEQLTTVEVGQNFTVVDVVTPISVVEVVTPINTIEISGITIIRDSSVSTHSTLEYPSQIALGGSRVVAITSTGIEYADPQASGATLGFTKYATDANSTATILFSGELGGFSGLDIGQPVYLSTNGTITQTPTMVGNLQIVGVAIGDSKINIQIQPPVFLG